MSDKINHDLRPDHQQILGEDALGALVRAFVALRDGDEARKFLTDLCTPKELRELSERLVIARLLDAGGLSYRDISAATGASTTTVGRVARFLQQEPHQGYRLVLDRVGALSDDNKSSKNVGKNPAKHDTKRKSAKSND
jgi:TrpR-related protein YerC/YecD